MTKENIRKLLLAIIFVLILIVIALFIGKFTYSYLGPAPTDELTGTGEVTPSGDTIIFSKGNDLSLSASTDNFHTGSGNLTDTTNPQVRLIASSDTNNASTTYYAGIRIYENTYSYSTTNQTAELILSVYDENGDLLEASSDTLSFVEVGGVKGFDITGKTGAYNIAIDHPISSTSSTNGTTHTWTFTLTFVNLDTDQSVNETANLEMEVVLQKDEITIPTFADNCRDSGSNTLACHVATTYTTDGENGLYYHDADLANGAGDNSYRYAGANPNNYVCFGSTTTPCPAENLYRIIGVLNDNGEYQVKLIKNTSIGNHYWSGSSSNRSNTWSNSTLNTSTLNGSYLAGLDNNSWSSMITTHTWKVGGMSSSNGRSTPQTAYNYEVGANSSSTPYNAKIGLMYVSDYGFAASNTYWSTELGDYNSATSNNWLYLGSAEWTISRRSGSNNAFNVGSSGYVYGNNSVGNWIAVRPVFYLNSSISYVSGSGSSADPIRLS